MLPRALAKPHTRYHTPWVSIIAFATVTFFVAISGGFKALAVLSSMALLLIYLGVCLAAPQLRYSRARPAGSFRAPGGPLAALLATMAVVWLLCQSSRDEAIAMAAMLVIACS